MKISFVIATAIVSAAALSVSAAPGDINAANRNTSTMPGSSSAAPQASAEDKMAKPAEVLAELHHANQMEIQMGKLAQEKGQSPQLKQYGATLVKDHQEADAKVKQVAAKQGIDLKAVPTMTEDEKKDMTKSNETMVKLQTMSGADFDKEFAKAMVDDHEKDIKKMKEAQDKLPAQSPVKQLVQQILPKLEQHRDTAEKLQKAS
jgi:predicted outer membrane protein